MQITQRPVVVSKKITDNRYQFEIDSLEPGFGYTLGNSLRRTLLSSIPGAAVTSIKIAGVKHEFETIPGVVEDVTEIILNIKALVISSILDDPTTIHIHADKAGKVTAKNIKTVAGIEIHNPDQYICTLSEKGVFDIEMIVERGRGYVPAEINKVMFGQEEIDRIAIDSIYSPVLKVTYSVDATRVGQRTDFDKLTMDVETKPSLSPVDAMASAGKTLVELFGLVRELNSSAEGIELGEMPVMTDFEDSIEILNLSTRPSNGLERAGIKTISQLLSYTEDQLYKLDNLGDKSTKEIIAALEERGLSLSKN